MAYQPKKHRKFLATSLSAAMVASAVAPVAGFAANFTDLDETNQFYKEIAALVEAGVLKGNTDGSFNPTGSLTRAEAAVIISNLLGLDTDTTATSKFSDVKAGEWWTPFITAAAEAGIISGYNGKFNPSDVLTRQDFAVIMAKAYDLELKEGYEGSFSDVPAGAYYEEAVNILASHEIILGTGDGKFGVNGKMQRQHVALMAYKADIAFGDLLEKPVMDEEAPVLAYDGELELTVANGAEFTLPEVTATDNVDEEVEVFYTLTDAEGNDLEELDTTVAGEYTLTYFAEDAAGNVSEELVITVTVESATPEVTGVSAINGKQIVVNFSAAVDVATIIESNGTVIDGLFTVVALKKADGTTNSAAVTTDALEGSLSQDGKTLTLTATGSEIFDGKYTVALNKGIKDAKKVEVPTFSTFLTVTDTVAPSYVATSSVAKTSTNTVTVTFSEPVQSTGVIAYVNGSAVSVAPGTSKNELVLTTGTALAAGSSNEVSFLNVKDYSGNFITPNPFKTQFTVTQDTAAPTVTSVNVVDENKVEVTFSKNVSQSSFANNARILDANGVLVTLLNASVDGKKVTLTTASNLTYGPNGTFTGNLLLGSDITDTLGNKVGTSYSQSVTFTKDTVAPAVASISYSNGAVVVTFNEDVTANALNVTGTTVINDSTGVATSLTNVFGAGASDAKIQDGNKLVIPTSLAAGSFTLRLPSALVKDDSIANNLNAATINTFTVSAATPGVDASAPVFTMDGVATSKVNLTVAGYNTASTAPDAEQTLSYVVQDANGLNLTTVRDVNNYTLNGKALPAGTYITTDYSGTAAANLTVTIHILSNQLTTSGTYTLVASNIKDTAGNTAAPQVAEDVTLAEGVKPTFSSAAIVTADTNTLVLGFSETVTAVTADDFVFTVNGSDISGAATLTPITSGTDKGKYYVTFATVTDSGKLYADVDGSGTFNAGDVEIATTADAAGMLNLNATYVTSVKVSVDSSSDIVDAQGNAVVTGSEKVVK